VYATSMTAGRATQGRPDVLELLTTLAAVPMAVGLGAAIGRMLPAALAPVVAALAPYVIYMGLIYANIRSNHVVFMDLLLVDQVDRTYLRLPVALVAARPLFWAAVGVALLSWTFAANRLAYGVTILAGFAASVVLLAAGVRIPAAAEYKVFCVDNRPRVCVDAAHHHLLNEYRDRIVDGLAKIRGLDMSDATIVLREDLFVNSAKYTGSAPDSTPSRQIVVPVIKRNTALAHEIDGRTLATNLGFAIFMSACLAVPQGSGRQVRTDAGLKTATILYHWWLTLNNLPTNRTNYVGEFNVASLVTDAGLTHATQQFAALSDNERAVWFAEQDEQILSCTALPPR
jgi:hypothetical protein